MKSVLLDWALMWGLCVSVALAGFPPWMAWVSWGVMYGWSCIDDIRARRAAYREAGWPG